MSKAQKQHPHPQDHLIRLKVIVRRLPPHLPEDVFWQSVAHWVTDDAVTWKSYHPGKLAKDINKQNIPSRAYIAFKTEEQIGQFSREFDGHVFRDKQGKESIAVVEFAPFQKVPPLPDRVKPDTRAGSIQKDEEFRNFVTSLKEPPPAHSEPPEVQAPTENKMTPLLEALLAEKTILKPKDGPAARLHHAKESSKHSATVAKDAPDTKGARPSKSTVAHGKGKEPERERQKPEANAKGGKRPDKRAKHNPSNSQGSSNPATTTPAATATHSSPSKAPAPRQGKAPPPVQQQHQTSALQKSPPSKKGPHAPQQNKPTPNIKRKPQAAAALSAAEPKPEVPKLALTSKNEGHAPPHATSSANAPDSSRPRRGRPVISMGRQFAAALNHAGLPGQRKDEQTGGSGT